MRQVYLPANAAEAHMLAHMLSEADIPAHVHGEALQGAAGDLPVGSMIQLMVSDEDYDRARVLLKKWEQTDSPGEPEARPGRRFRFVAAFVFLTVGIAAGWALKVGLDNSRFSVADSSVSLDQNGDGRDDVTWFYRLGSGSAYKSESDSNYDGRTDSVTFYDEVGTPTEARLDDNFDGAFETRILYRHGVASRAEIDTDGNEVVDLIQRFEHGVVRRQESTDHRYGHVVRIDHFGPLLIERSEHDLDRDGSLETVRTYDRFGEIVSTEVR